MYGKKNIGIETVENKKKIIRIKKVEEGFRTLISPMVFAVHLCGLQVSRESQVFNHFRKARRYVVITFVILGGEILHSHNIFFSKKVMYLQWRKAIYK